MLTMFKFQFKLYQFNLVMVEVEVGLLKIKKGKNKKILKSVSENILENILKQGVEELEKLIEPKRLSIQKKKWYFVKLDKAIILDFSY